MLAFSSPLEVHILNVAPAFLVQRTGYPTPGCIVTSLFLI